MIFEISHRLQLRDVDMCALVLVYGDVLDEELVHLEWGLAVAKLVFTGEDFLYLFQQFVECGGRLYLIYILLAIAVSSEGVG